MPVNRAASAVDRVSWSGGATFASSGDRLTGRLPSAQCVAATDAQRTFLDDGMDCVQGTCMQPSLRIASTLPLTELWTDEGTLPHTCSRRLAALDIKQLLRIEKLRFVVAECGLPLRWIEPASCYRFWKEELQPRLAPPEGRVRREDFPGEYFYWATEWTAPDAGTPIVLLERQH